MQSLKKPRKRNRKKRASVAVEGMTGLWRTWGQRKGRLNQWQARTLWEDAVDWALEQVAANRARMEKLRQEKEARQEARRQAREAVREEERTRALARSQQFPKPYGGSGKPPRSASRTPGARRRRSRRPSAVSRAYDSDDESAISGSDDFTETGSMSNGSISRQGSLMSLTTDSKKSKKADPFLALPRGTVPPRPSDTGNDAGTLTLRDFSVEFPLKPMETSGDSLKQASTPTRSAKSSAPSSINQRQPSLQAPGMPAGEWIDAPVEKRPTLELPKPEAQKVWHGLVPM